MIVNIRGGSGSGKTFLVRQLMAVQNAQPILDDDGKIEAYHLDGNIYVIGRYNVMSGGCDRIPTQDKLYDCVRKYAAMGHVIFEGLFVSTGWKRYHELSQELGGAVWAFLDTSLEQCLANVFKRNGGKPVNEKSVQGYWEQGQKWYGVAKAAGERAVCLRYDHGFEDLVALLHEEIPFYEEASV